MTPEAKARLAIDQLLTAAGWSVQDYTRINLYAQRGVAVREYPLRTGFADYLLFADQQAIGVVEAKAVGMPLGGITHQSQKYGAGLPTLLPAWRTPLPFLYESTGVETLFTNGLDPEPRSRNVYAFHQPATLAAWVQEPVSLRAGLLAMPPLITHDLWPAQVEALRNLERSLAQNRPRALIQMATGSGKTFTAVNEIYRLIKFAGARRVLFLVDRGNLGRQTFKEFQQFATPDDGRKFTELYNVQHLQSNSIDAVSRVCITTIQRLYSMLSGEAELDANVEEPSLWEQEAALKSLPAREVSYNPRFPIETFDSIFTDECHRSIYNLWRQAVEYFDAFLVGMTATPSKQTFGFFNQNLVMEYSRQQAVADGVNVDGEVYRIRTRVTEQGGAIEAGYWTPKRDRLTRQQRWEQLDEDFEYTASQLDRDVVTPDQIRAIVRTYRDRLFTDLFPGRTIVPKTLIYAKDDSHAETVVDIVREEFAKGNDFCQKITYRVSGKSPEELIAEFRNSYNPRIAVTVDMIATGTDIKPLEVLIFLRAVKSRVLYEQMIGRGTRVISANDLSIVTSDAGRKERFVIVDAVGVTENPKFDTQTLERKRTVPFAQLLQAVATGMVDGDALTSLAGRLATLERSLSAQDRYDVRLLNDGRSLHDLSHVLLDAVDPDRHLAAAQAATGVDDPPDATVTQTAHKLMRDAARLLAANPNLRAKLVELHQRNEQVIDVVTIDEVIDASYNPAVLDLARSTVDNFRRFIDDNKDEITALQLLYSRPYGQRALTYRDIQDLAKVLEQSPYSWTTERLWQAYAQVEKDKVRGAGSQRLLTDLISLVRHAVQLEDELTPYLERVQQRYAQWLADQAASGRSFTPEQRWWLDRIAEQIGVNLAVQPESFDTGEFFDRGGRFGAMRTLGGDWLAVVEEMNRVLVA